MKRRSQPKVKRIKHPSYFDKVKARKYEESPKTTSPEVAINQQKKTA